MPLLGRLRVAVHHVERRRVSGWKRLRCRCSAFVILIGPVVTESVEVALASTAVGIISGVGEIVAGGVAPAFAGYVAKNFGIEKVFYTALGGLIVALI
jgi:hypothetical protein